MSAAVVQTTIPSPWCRTLSVRATSMRFTPRPRPFRDLHIHLCDDLRRHRNVPAVSPSDVTDVTRGPFDFFSTKIEKPELKPKPEPQPEPQPAPLVLDVSRLPSPAFWQFAYYADVSAQLRRLGLVHPLVGPLLDPRSAIGGWISRKLVSGLLWFPLVRISRIRRGLLTFHQSLLIRYIPNTEHPMHRTRRRSRQLVC